jgi:pimeloyl-ACP methyl ester carboxylesterase
MGLPIYAEKFAAAGFVVFAFDYRGFGGSGGEPRHWVDPRRHVRDWAAAVRHVGSGALDRNANLTRHVGEVLVGRAAAAENNNNNDKNRNDNASSSSSVSLADGSRLALWGMSYSGGHVLVTAATPGMGADTGGPVRAIISNEPFLKAALARAPLERGLGRVLRLFLAAASDLLRQRLGLPAVYVRLAAPLSDKKALAVLQLQDSDLVAQRDMHGQRAAQQARADALARGLSPADADAEAEQAARRVRDSPDHPRPARQGGWRNVIAARFLWNMLGYTPLNSVPNVRVPVYLRVATKDHICPPEVVLEAARLFPRDKRASAAPQLKDSAQRDMAGQRMAGQQARSEALAKGNGGGGAAPELVVAQSPVTHIEALVHGARDEEIAPVVAFLWRHLGGGGGKEGAAVEEEEDALELMEADD